MNQVSVSLPSIYSLDALMRMWKNGRILKPDFQRQLVWSKPQERSWVEDIMNREPMPGVLTIYQIPQGQEEDQYYVADGYQRLSTLYKMWSDPKHYRLKKKDVERIFDSVQLAVVIVNLPDHRAGYTLFRKLNIGTAADIAEFLFGHIALDENASGLVLNGTEGHATYVEKMRADSLMDEVIGMKFRSRPMVHKLDRDALALFYEWLDSPRKLPAWKDLRTRQANPDLDPDGAFDGKIEPPVEVALTRLIKKRGMSPKDVTIEEQKFRMWVGKFTTRMRDVANEAKPSNMGNDVKMSASIWRTFLHWYLLARSRNDLTYGDVDDVIRVLAKFVTHEAKMTSLKSGIVLEHKQGQPRITFNFGTYKSPLDKIGHHFPEVNKKLIEVA